MEPEVMLNLTLNRAKKNISAVSLAVARNEMMEAIEQAKNIARSVQCKHAI